LDDQFFVGWRKRFEKGRSGVTWDERPTTPSRLDGEPASGTVKIHNVAANAVLTPKLRPLNLRPP